MARLEKIERDIERAQTKVAEWQTKVKELFEQRTEQENIEIVGAVRALKMTREELLAFIRSGTLPSFVDGAASIPSSRYSRRKQEPEAVDDVASYNTNETNTESEENENEE